VNGSQDGLIAGNLLSAQQITYEPVVLART
jgi:hypothetical protein